MTTDRNDDQEAPGVMAETEDDDTEGHRFAVANSDDPDFTKRELGAKKPHASDEGQTETNRQA